MKKEVKEKTKKSNKKIWTYIKKCIPYFAKEKKAVITLIILSLVISIFSSFSPALMAKILDYATSGSLDKAIKYSVLYLAWSERQLKEFALSAERIFEVIDHTKYEKEHYGNKRVNELYGKIEFKNVHFKYDKDEVLKGVNFTIEPKDTVAIVGKSGSGKSTIINLLSKIYEVTKGEILIDGYNVNDLDKFSLRNNIAVISQKPYLFNMTIKENLLLVNPDASQKQIENVCKICELHDYIMTLPKKYNTIVGEGGVTLSGGECQRVAIARALLRKTNIILFDEATSALDNETQANIQKAINNISSEYTMLIVAHRLSTIKDCNKIIVVNDGKICGVGSHKELYKNNEIYRTLYENELQKEENDEN